MYYDDFTSKICPFRIDTEFEYATINGQVVQSSQHEEFSPCMGDKCPFYEYGGGCNRVDSED